MLKWVKNAMRFFNGADVTRLAIQDVGLKLDHLNSQIPQANNALLDSLTRFGQNELIHERMLARSAEAGESVCAALDEMIAVVNGVLRANGCDMRNASVHPESDSLSKTVDRLSAWRATFDSKWGGIDSFPIPKFFERNFWEPTVQIALRDFCKPGAVVFDVGANAGALAAVMSRQVGPRGIVCAFEASPRIIEKTHYNLVVSGATNVYLHHKAVFSKSGEIVKMFAGTHLNDSIYNDYGMDQSTEVETISLDDFVEHTQLKPELVKMDIEGAEYDALSGFASYLRSDRPIIILEQSPNDVRCFNLLRELGYIAVDLSDYTLLSTDEEFTRRSGIMNLIFLDPDRNAGSPYLCNGDRSLVARLDKFHLTEKGNLELQEGLVLEAGRYVFEADFSAKGIDNEVFLGVDAELGCIFRYHAYTKLLADSYRTWVISLNRRATVRPFLRYVRGFDPDLVWNSVSVYRLPSFERHKHSIIDS